MEEKEEGGKIIYKTEDMEEARRKWGEVCDDDKARYFGFDNGIYTIEANK